MLCFKLLACRVLHRKRYHTTTFDFRKRHHQQPKHLNDKYYGDAKLLTLFTACFGFPCHISVHVFPQSSSPSSSPNPTPLHTQTCYRPSLIPKRHQVLGVSIQLSSHLSVRTQHKGIMQPKLVILTNLQDPYLVQQSIFYPTSKYYSNMFPLLGSICDIFNASQRLYQQATGIIGLPSHYQKCINSHLEYFSGKFQK